MRVLEGYHPGERLPGLQRLGIHGKPCAQLADCKTLATCGARCVVVSCRHAWAAYARVDVLSDALGSDGSMTMTHNNVMAVLLWLGTARAMVTTAANRSTTVAVPGRRRKLGYVMTNSKIRTAVAAWLSNSASAEATYGHISTWKTGGVTDMSFLFCAYSVWSSYGCNTAAASFNEDIGAWDTSGVMRMEYMFYDASAFDQDLSWCVDDNVGLSIAFRNTPCASTSCGITQVAGGCAPTPAPTTPAPTATFAPTATTLVADDSTIRTAVAAWLADATAAEASYGHISTWKTDGVTDMSYLFCVRPSWWSSSSYDDCVLSSSSFNEDIGAWDTSGVMRMEYMFYDASAFDQDLGWCVDDNVGLSIAFRNTPVSYTHLTLPTKA